TGTPTEYLTVPDAADANFSQYTAGGDCAGTSVRTSFARLRLDPGTLVVTIGDDTFATTTGGPLCPTQDRTTLPYGEAMSCVAQNDASGAGNIDLRGTPFHVATAPDGGAGGIFALTGYLPAGAATYSADDQVVDLAGG